MSAEINTLERPRPAPSVRTVWLIFAAIFLTVYFASLFSPPLLDDVDAAHAQAAQHMAESGDWITSKIDGIRYIEKPPLPYWLVAAIYRIFGQNTFATHLPNALAMLGSPGSRGCGRGAPGALAPASMPASACSPPSGRFSLRASSFPRPCSAFFCCWRSTA